MPVLVVPEMMEAGGGVFDPVDDPVAVPDPEGGLKDSLIGGVCGLNPTIRALSSPPSP